MPPTARRGKAVVFVLIGLFYLAVKRALSVNSKPPDRNVAPQRPDSATVRDRPSSLCPPATSQEVVDDSSEKSPLNVFVRFWVTPLLIVVAASAYLAADMWHRSLPDPSLPHPVGGLVMFVDDDQRTTDTYRTSARPSAALRAEVAGSGFDGISYLKLHVTFANVTPGARWYIAASGQYHVPSDLDLVIYCNLPGAVREPSGDVACRNPSHERFAGVEYRFTDRIGGILNQAIARLVDLDGYEDETASVVTGEVATSSYPGEETTIWIPFKTPEAAQYSGNEYHVLAPVFVYNYGDYGTIETLRTLPSAYATTAAPFADVRSGHPVGYIHIASLDLRASYSAGQQVQYSSPPTSRSDQLDWTTTGEGLGQVSYELRDPFAANRSAGLGFAAGLLASIAAAAAFLLLEKLLDRWQARRVPRRS